MKKSIENIVHHSEVSEKEIEKYLVKQVRAMGGICLKYSNANMVGYPDRVAILPFGVTVWVELKSRGKKPTKIQVLRHEELKYLGHHVIVLDSKPKIDQMVTIWGCLIEAARLSEGSAGSAGKEEGR